MKFARSNNIKTINLSAGEMNVKMDKITMSQYLFSKQ